MPAYRSRTTTHGRNMAGARSLWRATGMKDDDFGKPIIAVVNSFTVAEGTVGRNGTFASSNVLAKHDENYMPEEVVQALKERGDWQRKSGS